MKIQIKNYRGCISADVELEKIAAVFGPNGAGKSSIAGAAKALLMSDPLASTLVTKRDALRLVNEAARAGQGTISSDEYNSVIDWPECETTSKGILPNVSEVGLGITDVLTMEKKKRDKFFSDLMNACPEKADLYKALGYHKDANERTVEKLWEDIEINGWDPVSKHNGEKATQKKGAWKQITGQNWGSAKASSYVPEHWAPDLDKSSESKLTSSVVGAQDTIEAIAASNAIDDAELAHCTGMVAKLPHLEEALAETHAAQETLAREMSEPNDMLSMLSKNKDDALSIDKKVKALPAIKNDFETLKAKISDGKRRMEKLDSRQIELMAIYKFEVHQCPKCSARLTIGDQGLQPAPQSADRKDAELADKELAEIRIKISKGLKWMEIQQKTLAEVKRLVNEYTEFEHFNLDAELETHEWADNLKLQQDNLKKQEWDINKEITEATAAQSKLDATRTGPKMSSIDINEAREHLRIAQADLQSWKKKNDSDQVARTIDHYLEISKVLSASGIRKEILAGAIDKMNTQISSWSPWPIKIKNDLSFTFDTRQTDLCCESEQWIVSTVIQIFIALTREEGAIVVDRLDILDNSQKNKFFKMLVGMPFRSLLMMKTDNKKFIIDLAKKDIGQSYWVENGVCSPI